MDEVKRVFREGESTVKEKVRDIDGHDASDDLGNAGDRMRKDLGNAGDDFGRAEDRAEDEAERADRKF